MATTQKRGHGMGSIVKGKNGVFQFYWTDANGKRHKKSLRTRNRKEAEQQAGDLTRATGAKDHAEVLHQSAKARKIIDEKTLLFDQVWREYMSTGPDAGEGTLNNHKRHLNQFIEWLQANHPDITSFTTVTEDIAIQYAEHLWSRGMAAQTFNYHKGSLSAITNRLKRKYGIRVNPWEAVERRKDEQQQRRRLTGMEVRGIIEETKNDPELHILFMLGAYARMRLKDAALLRWCDVDMQRRLIEYRPFKTRRRSGKSALVPITGDLSTALTRTGKNGDHVLPGIKEEYEFRCGTLQRRIISVIDRIAPPETTLALMQK